MAKDFRPEREGVGWGKHYGSRSRAQVIYHTSFHIIHSKPHSFTKIIEIKMKDFNRKLMGFCWKLRGAVYSPKDVKIGFKRILSKFKRILSGFILEVFA